MIQCIFEFPEEIRKKMVVLIGQIKLSNFSFDYIICMKRSP